MMFLKFGCLCWSWALFVSSVTNAEKPKAEKRLLPKAVTVVESERSNYDAGNNGLRYLVATLSNSNQQPFSMYNSVTSSPVVTTAATQTATAQTTTTTTAPRQTTPVTAATTSAPPSLPVLLGSKCKANADCASISNSQCRNGVCDCNSVTVALANITCLPLATAFGDKCVVTAQCKGLDPLAACYLDRCMCESVYFVAGLSCAASVGGDYYLPASNMGSPSIQCMRKQHLGGACCNDRQCSYEVWNSMCVNSQCQCASGFVNIGTHACAPKAKVLGGPCSVNAQCMDLPGTSCDSNGNCTCDAQAQFVTGMMVPIIAQVGGTTDRRKRQAMSAVTITAGGSSMGMISAMCMSTVRLGAVCMFNEQCSVRTPNSICASGVCTCSTGFLPDPATGLTCQKKTVRFQKSLYEFQVTCCGSVATQPSFVGLVCPNAALTNIPAPYTFTISDPAFSIDTNGVITTNATFSTSTTVSVTIASGTRTDMARVVLVPAPCCTTTPSATASAVTVTLQSIVPVIGCINDPGIADLVLNSFELVDLADLFEQPCGEVAQIQNATSTSTNQIPAIKNFLGITGLTIPAGGCTVENNFLQFNGALSPGSKATCTLATNTLGCNGQVASSTVTVNLVCPAGNSALAAALTALITANLPAIITELTMLGLIP